MRPVRFGSVSDVVTMDKIVSLARRRGFVFPSSEIYGGLGSSYDYGHYGVLLKDNVKARWLEAMVRLFQPEIAVLLRNRDQAVMDWRVRWPRRNAFEDTRLEIASNFAIDLEARLAAVEARGYSRICGATSEDRVKKTSGSSAASCLQTARSLSGLA